MGTGGRGAARESRFASRISVLGTGLRLVRSAAPRELNLTALSQVIGSLATIGGVLAGGILLDRLIDLPGTTTVQDLALPLGGFLLATTVGLLAGVLRTERQRLLGEMTQRYAVDQVLRSTNQTDLVSFEQPTFHDRLVRAYGSAGSRPVQLVSGLLGIVSSMVTILGLGVALAALSPAVLVVVVVAFIPLWWTARQATVAHYAFARAETETDRRRNHIINTLLMRDWAAEIRSYGVGEHLRTMADSLHRERIERLGLLVARRTRLGAASALLSVGIAGAVISVLARLVDTGDLGVEQAAVAMGALLVMAQRLQTLSSSASKLLECALFLEDVEAFKSSISNQEHPSIADTEPIDELRLEQVAFRYPTGTRNAVHDVDLQLQRGELVALVGENGSGKTTLARVIAGLYQPTSGKLFYNGIPHPGGNALTSRVAMVHQNYVRFAFTAQDNITLGRVEAAADRERVIAAAEFANIATAIADLAHGFDTMLGPEYTGGQDFSGGQWQRLAVARAWFRDSDVVILDEPTSALDPQAEVELIEKMLELASDKLVILISHRFGTVSKADRILFLEEGAVVEDGSHQQLMDLGGRYSALYRLQAGAFER